MGYKDKLVGKFQNQSKVFRGDECDMSMNVDNALFVSGFTSSILKYLNSGGSSGLLEDVIKVGQLKDSKWEGVIANLEEQHCEHKIRRRLSRWKMKMLSIGGRLMLIKSVLGSMPIFHMSMFKVPAGVIQILESLRSKFFNGHESSGKKASWVQWKKALAPKDNGGLGIFSLYALNRGLIFKWVWRFLAHEPTLWSRVIKAIHGANGKIDEISGKGANSCWINIIKEVRRLEEKGINLLLFMKKKLGNGLSTLFWDDVWCDGGKLKNRFPRAYALENSKQITVGQKLAHPSLYHSFRRHPRGGLELTQVEELAKVINPVVLTQSPDSWSWTLNNSGGYTVASSRNMIDSRLLPKGDLKTRWIRYVPNKVNTFAWKVMTNSLPTRFNISRRGIDIESLSCVNCDVGIETNDHLFFACNTAKKISKLINRWWDVPFMDINSYGEWRSWIDNVKLPKKNKSMFQVLITGVGIDAILCLAGTIGFPYFLYLFVVEALENRDHFAVLLRLGKRYCFVSVICNWWGLGLEPVDCINLVILVIWISSHIQFKNKCWKEVLLFLVDIGSYRNHLLFSGSNYSKRWYFED
ncbi:RNA-directed DNA polymerase, eukaryota, reverse transcriptase zinc-binding domain protein [Tanacetum coccineum]